MTDIFEQTRLNKDALAIYREACRILTLPTNLRLQEIRLHDQPDRLVDEVKRVWKQRKERAKHAKN